VIDHVEKPTANRASTDRTQSRLVAAGKQEDSRLFDIAVGHDSSAHHLARLLVARRSLPGTDDLAFGAMMLLASGKSPKNNVF
jgi:hypothetical protein